jgi:ppGpp synthetase/RelA/SpoT-type nucleotidyltranferase
MYYLTREVVLEFINDKNSTLHNKGKRWIDKDLELLKDKSKSVENLANKLDRSCYSIVYQQILLHIYDLSHTLSPNQ